MRVLLTTYGSRGDVEPMVALAAALKRQGADAVVSAPGDQEFVELSARAGIELVPTFMQVRQWIKEKAKPSATADFCRLATEMISKEYTAIDAAAVGCDMIVATGLFPSTAAAQSVAEKRGIAYHHTTFCPLFLPSHHHSPCAYPGNPHPRGVTDPRQLWNLNADVMTARFGEPVNAHRSSIGLPTVTNVRGHVFTHRPLLASDQVLWPWLKTDLCDAIETGAWVLPDTRPLPADLLAFLEAGDAPIYVGFGSIALQSTRDAARTAIEALRVRGKRVVLARGWADNQLPDDNTDCFTIGEVNQQALFERVAAIIHHGGAGTTTTAARAGAPQLTVPQIVDQPFWGARVARLGIGAVLDRPAPTSQSMSDAIDIVLAPGTRRRATEIGRMMRSDGAEVAAELLVGELE